ncbi:hypothetical protein P8452_21630 [Trifolium repens]|nr:hypothetical protein P8452_21630 [Trifolium repens]
MASVITPVSAILAGKINFKLRVRLINLTHFVFLHLFSPFFFVFSSLTIIINFVLLRFKKTKGLRFQVLVKVET